MNNDKKKAKNDDDKNKPTIDSDPNYITLGESEIEKKKLRSEDSEQF